jgi:hypothetical protein
MNPADLVTPELIKQCSDKNAIVVCGYTKTGKVTIAKKIANELSRPILISDDYVKYNSADESLYALMDDVLTYQRTGAPFIVEGILCFRLLRKGMQLGIFNPDMIIKTKCNDETIRHFYNKDGEGGKINRALSFNKGLNTIWEDYLSLLSLNDKKMPNFVELNTSIY